MILPYYRSNDENLKNFLAYLQYRSESKHLIKYKKKIENNKVLKCIIRLTLATTAQFSYSYSVSL